MPTSDLRWDKTPADPRAVVLVLHGGQDSSRRPASWTNLAVLRMIPIAWNIGRAGGGELAVVRLRYAVRGWNGAEQSPVADTRAALDAIEARYPGVPIALVGHSMGGRVALRLSHDERVHDIVGLAPWVSGGDEVQPHPGLRLFVIHGLADRITSPKASRQVVETLQASGRLASFVGLRGEMHAMLHRWRTWDQLTAGFLRGSHAPPAELDGEATFERLGGRASSEAVRTVI